MCRPPGNLGIGPGLSEFRSALVLSWARPVGLLSLLIGSAAMIRTIAACLSQHKPWDVAMAEGAHVALYPIMAILPNAFAYIGRPDLVAAACITSHLVRSVSLLSAGLGVAPMVEAMRLLAQGHIELLLDVPLAFRDQLPLPTMALLYLLREAAWMSVVVYQLHGDVTRAVWRGVGNWVVLMLLACFFEVRLRAAYHRACQHLSRPTSMSRAVTDVDAFDSSLPSPTKGSGPSSAPHTADPGAATATTTSTTTHNATYLRQRKSDTAAVSRNCDSAMVATSGALALPSTPGADNRPIKAPDATTRISVAMPSPLQPALPTEMPPVSQAAGAGIQEHVLPAIPPLARAQHIMSTPPPVTEPPPLSESAPTAAAILQADSRLTGRGYVAASGSVPADADLSAQAHTTLRNIYVQQQSWHRRGYQRLPQHGRHVVHVKLHGLELEDMRPDLPTMINSTVTQCGCVLVSLDLACGEDVEMTEGMRHLLTTLVRQHTAGTNTVMSNGTLATVQVDGQTVVLQWQGGSAGYQPLANTTALPDVAASGGFSLVAVSPVVLTLAGGSSGQLELTAELLLPATCQLLSTNSPADATTTEDVSAKLLVRHMFGAYINTEVTVLSTRLWEERGSKTAGVKVKFGLDSTVGPSSHLLATGLSLELWCTTHAAPKLEWMMSHVPVLVLPDQWQTAAKELHQHIPQLAGLQALQLVPPVLHTPHPAASISQVPEPTSDPRCSQASVSADLLWDDNDPEPGPVIHRALSSCSLSQRAGSVASGSPGSMVRGGVALIDTTEDLHAGDDPADSDGGSRNACPAAELLEDLCGFVIDAGRQPHQASSAGSVQPAPPPPAYTAHHLASVGHNLLVYVVGQRMPETARLIVQVLQQQDIARSGTTGGSSVAHSAWWPGSGASDQAHDGAHALLDAAVTSGCADMVQLVLSWGHAYGGADWCWDWSALVDGGYTLLHLVAVQEEAATTTAMLQVLCTSLPPAQAEGARHAWLTCRGGVAVAPAALFAEWAPDAAVPDWWSDRSSDVQAQLQQQGPRVPPMQPVSTSHSGTGASAIPADTAAPAAADSITAATTTVSPTTTPSWWQWVTEVRTLSGDPAYQTWSAGQTSTLATWGCGMLLAIGAAALLRSYVQGVMEYEGKVHLMHNIAYASIVVPQLLKWNTSLGLLQVLMLLASVVHGLAYLVSASMAPELTKAWAHMADAHQDTLFWFMCALIDTSPFPMVLVVKVFLAYCHYQALQQLGVASPALRAVTVHTCAMLIIASRHIRQMRIYKQRSPLPAGIQSAGEFKAQPATSKCCEGHSQHASSPPPEDT